MEWLKQSTAADVILGPFVDDTDFKTAETGLSIAQADIRLSKNGAAFAQTNNSAGATHREGGDYKIPLDTTDTNTLGRLRVRVSVSGALIVWKDFLVVPANAYDSLVGGSDYLDASVREFQDAAFATFTVQADGGNSATQFKTDRTETSSDHWKDALVILTSGTLSGQIKRVSAYNGTSKIVTVSGGFTSTPANGVTGIFLTR